MIKESGFGKAWPLYKLATPQPESDMKDAFPEAKGKKEIIMKTLMETIWKSSMC